MSALSEMDAAALTEALDRLDDAVADMRGDLANRDRKSLNKGCARVSDQVAYLLTVMADDATTDPVNTEAAPFTEELNALDDLVVELRGHVEEQHKIAAIDGTVRAIHETLWGIAVKAGALEQMARQGRGTWRAVNGDDAHVQG